MAAAIFLSFAFFLLSSSDARGPAFVGCSFLRAEGREGGEDAGEGEICSCEGQYSDPGKWPLRPQSLQCLCLAGQTSRWEGVQSGSSQARHLGSVEEGEEKEAATKG